jgi:hypothetical protein
MSHNEHPDTTHQGPTVVVLVASGPAEGLRLRYVAVLEEDCVVV